MATKKTIPERFSNWYIPLICKHQYKALAFYLILAVLLPFLSCLSQALNWMRIFRTCCLRILPA